MVVASPIGVATAIVLLLVGHARAQTGSCCISGCRAASGSASACGQRFTEAECAAIEQHPFFGSIGCTTSYVDGGTCGAQGDACFLEAPSFACSAAFGASAASCVVTTSLGCREDSLDVVKSTLADCCANGSTSRGACVDESHAPVAAARTPAVDEGACCITCEAEQTVFGRASTTPHSTCIQSVNETHCDVVALELAARTTLVAQSGPMTCRRTAFSANSTCGSDGRMQGRCVVTRPGLDTTTGCCAIDGGHCFATDAMLFGRYPGVTREHRACRALNGFQDDAAHCCADGTCSSTCAEFDVVTPPTSVDGGASLSIVDENDSTISSSSSATAMSTNGATVLIAVGAHNLL